MSAMCDAVAAGLTVEFNYSGKLRVVKLGAHGHHRLTGNELVRGYQTGGASSSGVLPDWRLFYVTRMADLRATTEPIGMLPADFNPNDSDLIVHCSAPGQAATA